MSFTKRSFMRSVGSIVNLNPRTDYRSYTSVQESNSCFVVKRDLNKVAGDLKRALNNYESKKQQEKLTCR
ncbi:hypothetical protein RCS94_02150 [Orbaceae bacterium ac157xtp]